MKTLTLSTCTVSVPTTADDWELYTSSMKCGNAARALTAATIRVIKTIDAYAQKGYAPTPEGASKLYREIIEPVMSRYSKFGAYDTEPRGVAYYTMERAIQKITGRSIYF